MKKYYRITIYKNHDLCDILVPLAAKSNGGQYLTLPELIAAAKARKMTYPTLCGEFTAELIGDGLLHIDAKTGADTYETVLSIEEVEVYELEGWAAMAD